MAKLPIPGDPLVQGSTVYHENDDGDIVQMPLSEYSERRVSASLLTFKPTKTINISDLPEQDHREQVGIAAIIGLKLLGLTEEDIAEMLTVDVSEIKRIIKTGPAQSTFERMYQALINVSASNLQGRIAAYGDNAVSTVARLMNDDKAPEIVQLKAAQDILDRSGTAPNQFFAANKENGGGEDELRISFFDENSEEKKVEVNITRKK